ncbi:zf-TFIIB domain-containing protein [Agromyces mediolanus]|uniref:TFIIB-type zinc ribbon-containing protein n=1 Tax=Agromyces mediolanus TaxID=41986 RepID=UPI00203B3DA0|nr:zf-TFIIB domain-containing protein [Agromyces mediolanus]MCM3658007.1 zf-TFIIB domain-containing protein [Agromyces mediolanus]
MQCPVDGAVLVMSERSGIEIDYCPTCRGVWLDRGELDKILERAGRELGAQPAPQQPAPQQQPGQPQYQQPAQQGGQNPMDLLRQMTGQGQGYDQRGYDQRGYDQGHYRKKKKENWLSELFD